ncbi:MAG: penicillin-binding transpeptidase domain-containing protein, partial [Lachnospiraceae bacterium]|nr:penicillin-binding transpeptidase domain-containing protein [Lachnospiraceae bacterium]
AGKTGTAQQAKNRPDHALFVGYAPYDEPEISIVTRIPFGYTSSYAVQVSAHILGRYDFENGGSVDSDLQDTLDNLSISSNISTGD